MWNIWKDNAQELWKTRHTPTDQRSSENNKQAYIHTQTQVHTPQPHTYRHNIVTAEKQNNFKISKVPEKKRHVTYRMTKIIIMAYLHQKLCLPDPNQKDVKLPVCILHDLIYRKL